MHIFAVDPDCITPLPGAGLPEILALLHRGFLLGVDFNGAARIAGLSRSSLYAAVGRGDLPIRKAGARSIILVQDLDDFLRTLPPGRFGETADAETEGVEDPCAAPQEDANVAARKQLRELERLIKRVAEPPPDLTKPPG